MKVKINSLPKGYNVVNGKIMRSGGSTGDQDSSYGLIGVPQFDFAEGMPMTSLDPFSKVNNVIQEAPRSEANLEAEKGETVLTDMNNDGEFELYDIGGSRHTHGGTPLNVPPQSFIYSDTRSMKLDSYELAEMGIDSKKKLTPADVSKKYQLNKYIAVLSDPNSDKIARDTAEYMLQKNKESLSQLAFLQEAKKEFEDGVPLAAYPYLQKKGINPMEFSQKVEQISEEEAKQKMMMQMPPEDREKLMQLQALMAKAHKDQAINAEQQRLNDPMMQTTVEYEPTQVSPEGSPPEESEFRFGGDYLPKAGTGFGFKDMWDYGAKKAAEYKESVQSQMNDYKNSSFYKIGQKALDYGQDAVSLAGNIPGPVGAAFDTANTGISAARLAGSVGLGDDAAIADNAENLAVNALSIVPGTQVATNTIKANKRLQDAKKLADGANKARKAAADTTDVVNDVKDEVTHAEGSIAAMNDPNAPMGSEGDNNIVDSVMNTAPGTNPHAMAASLTGDAIRNEQANNYDFAEEELAYNSEASGDFYGAPEDDPSLDSFGSSDTAYGPELAGGDGGDGSFNFADSFTGDDGGGDGDGLFASNDGDGGGLFSGDGDGDGLFSGDGDGDGGLLADIGDSVSGDGDAARRGREMPRYQPGGGFDPRSYYDISMPVDQTGGLGHSIPNQTSPISNLNNEKIQEIFAQIQQNNFNNQDLKSGNIPMKAGASFTGSNSNDGSNDGPPEMVAGASQTGNQNTSLDPALVTLWEEHIKKGGTPPHETVPEYTEAYNNIYGEDPTGIIKNQEDINKELTENLNNDEDDDKATTLITYNTYPSDQSPDKPYDNDDTEDDDVDRDPNIYQGVDDEFVRSRGYDLDWYNTNNPYYVGSQFATGDTLDTMKKGGELTKAQGGIETDGNIYPIELNDGRVINNAQELEALQTSDPNAYNVILAAYDQQYNDAVVQSTWQQQNNIPSREDTEATSENYVYEDHQDWSEYYNSDDKQDYRDKRYEAYRIRREELGKDVLPPEEYHALYSHYQETNKAFKDTLDEETRMNNPNWDSSYEWEPCEEGSEGCMEKGDKGFWKHKTNEEGNPIKHDDPNWYYNQNYDTLGFTDENGEPRAALTSEQTEHMQDGYIAGSILAENPDITYADLQATGPGGDEGARFGDTNMSIGDGRYGDNTANQFDNMSETVETPAEQCTNAAQIKEACEKAGGQFIPWDAEKEEGCSCTEPIPEPEVPEPADPVMPEPEFWIQDEMGIANAMDAKFSLKKYYPWAPKYSENLIEPVFKDPTREIAAIGEQATIAADAASAFSGPQRAAAVQAKAQGVAAKQIADAMNKVQSDNVTIANTVAAKNAEIKYKTQVLNNNETKQLYDNTVLTEQNYDNALREANEKITAQLQNAYTNMANTYNLNTIYPNFNIHPETGGMIHVTNPKDFYADPNYVSPQNSADAYIDQYRTLKEAGIPVEKIPGYKSTATQPGKTSGQQDQQTIMNAGWGRRGGETRARRLQRKRNQLRNWFSSVKRLGN